MLDLPVRTTYVSKSNFFMPAAMASRLIMMRWPSCTGLTLCSAPLMLSMMDTGRSFMSFSTNCATRTVRLSDAARQESSARRAVGHRHARVHA